MSSLRILLAFLPPILLGFLVSSLLLRTALRTQILLKLSLGAIIGNALVSSLYFFWCFLFGPLDPAFLGIEILLCALAALWLWRRRHSLVDPPGRLRPPLHWSAWALLAVLAGVLAIAAINFYRLSQINPHGLFDSWTFWNMRARFIYRGGELWYNVFSPIIAHADYPMLIPTLVSRGWVLAGAETQRVPMFLAAIYTFAGVGLLAGALTATRTPAQAFLAALLLLATPWLVELGSSQYSDLPLAGLILATAVALQRYHSAPASRPALLALAGLSAGYAAWTKNEGQLFLLVACVVVAVLLFIRRRQQQWLQDGCGYLAGLALPLLTLAVFKLNAHEVNDVVNASNLGTLLGKIGDPERYLTIAKATWEYAGMLGGWSVPVLLILALYLLLVRFTRQRQPTAATLTLIAIIGLQFLGYLAIYLITPMELKLHINQSFARLTIHLYPTFLFLFFILVRAPEEIFTRDQNATDH